MPYPNFKNKHLEEVLRLAGKTGKQKKTFAGVLPKKCIITYQGDAFHAIEKQYTGRIRKLDLGTLWGCKASYTKDFVFVCMKGVGAPHATIVFEELIALGMAQFVNIGIAGGLDTPGFFICEKAIRDEGTSQHYFPHAKYAEPDKELTHALEASFNKLNVAYQKANNWTIDAPLMETKAEIARYKKQGVKTVDMEVSALFVVAKLRKVQIAAAFFTSDILGKQWKNSYRDTPHIVEQGLETLAKIAIDCFL